MGQLNPDRPADLRTRLLGLPGTDYRVAVVDSGVGSDDPGLWPSVGEYPVYDAFLYYCMTNDEARNRLYRSAIRRYAPGSVVVDIGTGADLNWARACLDAGAVRVHAIEEISSSFEKAVALSRRMNLGDRLQLHRGHSTEVSLPERVDLCVSETIGTIGSSEGVVRSLGDAASRFVEPSRGRIIPHRCMTYIAAFELPPPLRAAPTFSSEAYHYLRKVFEWAGSPFDVRLCVTGASKGTFLSAPAIFEDLKFNAQPSWLGERQIVMEVVRSGSLDGLLLWIVLQCEPDGDVVDSVRNRCSWLPVFFPLWHPGRVVEAGDWLDVRVETRLSGDECHPDYLVRGCLQQVGAAPLPFEFASHHQPGLFRQSPYYQALFTR